MSKLTLWFVSVLLMLAVGPVAATEPTKMRLGFSGSAGFVSAMVAKDQGFFEKHNLDVEMVFVTKGTIVVPSILGGSLEAGTMTAPSLIRGAANNLGLVALAATNVNAQEDSTSSLALRNGLEITKPTDLEGKRIGSSGLGGVLDITFRQWAREHGVNVKKITFVEVGFPQMADMLKAGQIDAATISEPYLSRMLEAKAGQRGISYFKDFPNGMLMGAFVVKKEWADKNREAALGFRAAIADAVELLKKDPSVANASLEKHLKLPAHVVKALPRVHVAVDITDEQLQFWNKVSKDQGLTTDLIDVSKIYYR